MTMTKDQKKAQLEASLMTKAVELVIPDVLEELGLTEVPGEDHSAYDRYHELVNDQSAGLIQSVRASH